MHVRTYVRVYVRTFCNGRIQEPSPSSSSCEAASAPLRAFMARSPTCVCVCVCIRVEDFSGASTRLQILCFQDTRIRSVSARVIEVKMQVKKEMNEEVKGKVKMEVNGKCSSPHRLQVCPY